MGSNYRKQIRNPKNQHKNYIHGYDSTEQNRLLHQAEFLEPWVYAGVDLEFSKNLLEIGCGVGAQTQILLRRFPKLNIDGVDLSSKQISLAKKLLSTEEKQGRVRFLKQDATVLSMPHKNYDAAFVCWFLEHVPNPLLALKRIRQHLKKGSKIYCSEVFNQSLFLEPYSPAFIKYWFEFNDYQWSIKGHPFVGALLGHLLLSAGYKNIQTEVRSFHFDSRSPLRKNEFIDYFFNILLSAEKTLLLEKRVTPDLVNQMKHEVEHVKESKDSVFFYSWIRATAEA